MRGSMLAQQTLKAAPARLTAKAPGR